MPLKTKMYSHCNLLVRENKRQLKRMKGAKAKTGRQKEDRLELLVADTCTDIIQGSWLNNSIYLVHVLVLLKGEEGGLELSNC